MRKFFSLSQCFLFCLALLFSLKSFATDCPSGGITTSTTCTGNISTSGASAYGIYANNSGTNSTNTVNMTGNITTTGGAYGIYLRNAGSGTSNSNTVNMTGNITTSASSAYGISLYNVNGSNNTNTVNMTGNISTSGANGYGIYLYNSGTSNNNTVNMTGNISTTGNTAYGIYLTHTATPSSGTSNSNTVNMTGNISTTGNTAYGIYLFQTTGSNNSNNSNTVNMTGNISTSGASGYGIYLRNVIGSNNSNTVNMTGNITTSGSSAYGIILYSFSGSNNTDTVNMTGNISTSGASGYGIYSNTDGSFITNTVNIAGNITTNGNSADAIFLTTSGTNNINTVNMTGNISTSHATAYGINLFIESGTSNSNTVNMTGRIAATDASSYAISSFTSGSTNSNIVQLNKGSSVIGGIYGGGAYPANNFLKLNLGAGASYSFATTGFTVTDLNGRPMVAGSAHAAGVGNVTTASQSLYERTSQITQSLDDRLRTHDLKQPSQDFWVNTYYSDSGRGGQGLSGSNLSFNQYRSGITAGFNVKNTYTPTELIVNYEHGKLNIDEGNQGISSNSVMAGALFPDIKKLFTGTLSAKAMVGYSDFSGDRKVLTNDVAFNGSRNVTANYQSSHLTIGSAWTKTLYQTDKIILDTLVGIDLNTQHINSYSESDLFKWNGRTINQLQERVTLGMEIKPLVKPLTLYSRVGIERRDLISGENQNYASNNTAVSYNDSNQRNTYATLNAGAYYPLTPTVKAYAQVRYYDSTKDIDSLSGSVGISGQF
jgi:hypothetical protein